MFERPRSGERALLVRIGLGAQVDPEDLEEFSQLAVSAGAQPVATVTGRRERPEPRFFGGSGKAEEREQAAAAGEPDLILVDHALSPARSAISRSSRAAESSTATDSSSTSSRSVRAASRASSKSSWHSCGTSAAAWCVAGATSSARRAASACVDPARHSSRPTGA